MFKHVLWAVVVLLVAVIGGYVALAMTGHSQEANALGGSVLFAVFMCFMVGSFWT